MPQQFVSGPQTTKWRAATFSRSRDSTLRGDLGCVEILVVRPSPGLKAIENRFCWLFAWALGASATMATAETSDKTQDAEGAKRASAEDNSNCGSDTFRNRDKLALITGLHVRLGESDAQQEKAPSANTTRLNDLGAMLARPRHGSKQDKSTALPCNMAVTVVLVLIFSCFISIT
ncbi:hypothetical protein N9Q06_01155 [bacterium]|nr:hypothetical protein [bacterium]